MKIQNPLTLSQKYLNDYQKYFNNADEKLDSYTYIPDYLKKGNPKKFKNSC